MQTTAKSELLAEASTVWKMLDEMAQNDPIGYKNFIERQLREGKKSLSPPSVMFVIRATLKASNSFSSTNLHIRCIIFILYCIIRNIFQSTKQALYVNYCEWNAIPEAKSEDSPISVKCGETFDLENGEFI
ncbi:hypothetical protein P879_07691 [Paragonimus westermani]|uniref:PIH1 N-terminal domain-containing protein n=1 Tax=Paragonimus westermani TaxID=34504 RepID=A0A8T0DDY0_9TREM|nr:hypothetical protein P879_07691 [Paragonimus westermani]